MAAAFDGRGLRYLVVRRPRLRDVLAAGGVVLGGCLLGLAPSMPIAADIAATTPDDDPARRLAERFRPVILIKEQRFDCDPKGEAWMPTDVDIVLGNGDVVLRQNGPGNPVLMRAPESSDLWNSGTAVHLDFPGMSLRPGCTYEDDFRIYSDGYEPTVYARVATQADRPGLLVVQYWFFWYYNRWNNLHEGDWEGIQLLFETDDPATATEPISVGYAQHEGGEIAGWTSETLARDGDRPLVYPSAGSHASYFSSAVYLGRDASTGFGCDDTTGPSTRLDPAVVMLPTDVEEITGPDDPMAWVAFRGRWGELNMGPYSGPTGPADKDRWERPIDWHEGLRSTSVVVPAAESFAGPLVDTFCNVVAGGSRAVVQAKISPWRLIVPVALLALAIRFLARRTTWGRTGLEPIIRRRSTGEILRAAFGAYRLHWRRLAPLGLIALPTAAVAAVVVALIGALPVIGPLLDLGGRSSALSIVTASISGGLIGLIALAITTAAVTAVLMGEAPSNRAALGSAGRRLGPLIANTVISAVVVGVMAITIIGLPIALWLAVRLRLFAPATMNGYSAPGALGQSSRLVAGRWSKVAVASLVANLAVIAIAGSIGLIIMIAVASLPLWVFSFVAVLIAVLLAPVVGVVDVLLYGDGLAAGGEPSRRADSGEPLSASIASE